MTHEPLLVPPQTPPPPVRRRIGIALVAALAAVATIVVVALLTRSSSPRSRPLPADPTSIDIEGSELIGLLTKGRAETFHATYEGTASGLGTGKLVVEVWRSGDRSRQDAEVTDGTTVVRTAAFRQADGTGVACQRRGESAWQCAPIQRVAQPTEQLIEQVTQELAGRSVTVRNDQIGGHAVRCFTIGGEGQTSEICATADGIPVRIGTGAGRLELVSISRSVDPGAFKTPA